MKRSEMLAIIQAEIYRTIMGYYEELLTDEAALAVLDKIEELGMKPPSVCFKDGKFDDLKYAAYLHMGKDPNFWEKE